MKLEVIHPLWLWLLPACVAWVVWLWRRAPADLGPLRRGFSLGLRLAGVFLLLLALAGLRGLRPFDGVNVMFVLDSSDSVSREEQAAARERVARLIRDKPPDDRAGLIVFGREAAIENSVSTAPDVTRASAVINPGATDLAAGLRLALAALPALGDNRVVLLSDGNPTRGDALGAAALLRGADVRVEVVPLAGPTGRDVVVARLDAPDRVAPGETFDLRALVDADEAGPATLSLYQNDALVGRQDVQLTPGRNLLALPLRLEDAGFHAFELRVDREGDVQPRNNQAAAFTVVRGRPRVLLVSRDPAADGPLRAALEAPERDLVAVGPDRFPASLGELQTHDAVVLVNVPATALARDQWLNLRDAVRDFGVGVIAIGGDEAFAAGAYKGTPLDELLPVESDLSSRKVFPSGALVLVLDRSGSMSGEKIQLARQAAAAAAELLTTRDYLAVLAFDGAVAEVVPLQRAGDRGAIRSAIAGIQDGGGTVMLPALERARDALAGVPAAIKHVVVLSDGVSAPGDFEAVVRDMAAQQITVSTIGLGEDCDVELMSRLAALGGGRFYFVPQAMQLPQIFIQETAVILRTAIREEAFLPQPAATTEPVRGLGGAWPALRGHVVTMPKPRAETPLLTDQGDPLLAHWQFGLGRALAFTSDAQARWAAGWLDWERYGQFWRQALQWTLRRLDDAGLEPRITFDGETGRLAVTALDERGEFRNFLQLEAAVFDPRGGRQVLVLNQTGPGQYEAAFPAEASGSYLVQLRERDGDAVRAVQVAGATAPHAAEFAARGTGHALLQRITEITSGRVLVPDSPGAGPFQHDRRRTWQPHELRDWLLRAAILLFVLDVAVRRVMLDPAELRRVRDQVLARLPRLSRPAPLPAAGPTVLDTLLVRRDETRARQPVAEAVRPVAPAGDEAELAVSRTDEPPPVPRAPASTPAAPPPEEEASTTTRLLEAKRRARKDGRG